MTVTAIPQQPTAETAEAAPKKSRKKLLVIVVAVLLLGGAAYWFVLRPKPEGPPMPGEVVKLEPIQVNLAAAHYLRLGLSLQLTTKAHEVDGSKALDAAIEIFSGKTVAEVNATKGRTELKKELVKRLGEVYEHEVMGVYFTEFVTQ